LELFVSANVDLRVLTLPDDADPADFLLEHGADAFRKLTESASDALSHAFHTATESIDTQNDLHAATTALEQLVATIAKAPRLRGDTQVEDRLREEKFLQRLATDFRVPEGQVRELMTQMRRKTATRQPIQAAPASSREKIEPLDRELLELLLTQPDLIERFSNTIRVEQITGSSCRDVYSLCVELWSQGIVPDFSRLLLEIDDPVVKTMLVELDESGRRKASELQTRVHDVLASFERRERERQVRHRTSLLKQSNLTAEDELALLLEITDQQLAAQQALEERSRLGISDPTEG
jgi:DNA primase